MKVPVRLRRRPEVEPARALWLPTADAGAVLGSCIRLGRLPRIFALAEGLLLKLPQATSAAFPGTVRLRGLAADLFVPCDAELVPPLRADEAEGLVRRRGLVFLPGGRVLAYDPAAAVSPATLLRTANRDGRPLRREWRPLPEPPRVAERITEIVLDLPPAGGDELLAAGAGDIGSEDPRPADGSPAERTVNRAKLGLGKTLAGLGQALGWKGLAAVGAKMIKDALDKAPRLGEGLFGRQEAALRELLKDFRDGNLEKALRRALPLAEPGSRGVQPHTNSRLPTNDLRYTLGGLMGGGRGPASVWLTPEEVHRELMREYRRAAELALKQGDFRRAAFIYGRLLRDYRSSANALMQGGLHLDAAVIFLEKVRDVHMAARAFEAGGEFDRAVKLYIGVGDFVPAGDLLRRLGEEDAALEAYRRAAEQLVRSSANGYLAAGELLLNKAGCAELAEEFFTRGWKSQERGQCAECAVHLARLHAARPTPDKLLELVGEAEEHLRRPGHESQAALFFNAVAGLAERPNFDAVRGELRDRALGVLALKLRQGVASGGQVGSLLPSLLTREGAWSPAALTDAEYAVKRAAKKPPEVRRERPVTVTRLGTGRVTAVCHSPAGRVFVGFDGGEVVELDPALGSRYRVSAFRGGTVASLACSDDEEYLAVLEFADEENLTWMLSLWRRSAGGRSRAGLASFHDSGAWLLPLSRWGAEWVVGVGMRFSVLLLGVPHLNPASRLPMAGDVAPVTAFVLPGPDGGRLHLFGSGGLWNNAADGKAVRGALVGWTPAPPEAEWPGAAPVAVRLRDPHHLEMAAVDRNGHACWALVRIGDEPRCLASLVSQEAGFRAATLARPGLVAAAGPKGVEWLRCGTGGFRPHGSCRLPLPSAVACCPSHLTDELIVVCGDGTALQVRHG